MIKKIQAHLVVAVLIAGTAVASYRLGTIVSERIGEALVRRFYKPRIAEIIVWNGEIPTHPSQL